MRVRLAVSLLTAAVLLFPAASFGVPSTDELRESLRKAESDFARAFDERDLDAFLALVDEDVVFLGGRENLRGKAAVAEVWSRYFETDVAPFAWKPERYEVNPSGTLGMTTGPVTGPDGKWVSSFMSIWKLQPDGTWRVIFDGAPRCPTGS
ncbi:MAG: DUF4440 domain-containing protein [Thermoanaerobaculia bacterium]